jgi:ketosteroid isomerase-like protein
MRKLTKFFTAALVATVMTVAPARAAANSTQTEEQVKATLQQLYTASANADMETIDRLFSDDTGTLILGSDPTEVAVGHVAAVQFWAGLFQFLKDQGYPNNGGLKMVSAGGPIQVDSAGSVAWVTDMAEFQFAGGNTPFRLTAVMHREQGKWKFIQLHFSVPVPNSALPI